MEDTVRPHKFVLLLLVFGVSISACGTGSDTSPSTSSAVREEGGTATSMMETSATTEAGELELVDGMFDVGGHKIHLECQGTGTPTVMYFHGAIRNPGDIPTENAAQIRNRVKETNRFCSYERRNVATSETVDAPQHPEDVISDLRNLLDAAEVQPPYVLLGASFGGLPAYLYANEHPDEVVGMVLLDAMFPDLLSIDHLLPAEFRQEASSDDELDNSLERISHFEMLTEAQQYIGREPQIPLIFLASEQEPPTSGIPEWDEQIIPVGSAFVDRFSPGELIWVDAPHFMEPAIPDEITDALLRVIDLAKTG